MNPGIQHVPEALRDTPIGTLYRMIGDREPTRVERVLGAAILRSGGDREAVLILLEAYSKAVDTLRGIAEDERASKTIRVAATSSLRRAGRQEGIAKGKPLEPPASEGFDTIVDHHADVGRQAVELWRRVCDRLDHADRP